MTGIVRENGSRLRSGVRNTTARGTQYEGDGPTCPSAPHLFCLAGNERRCVIVRARPEQARDEPARRLLVAEETEVGLPCRGGVVRSDGVDNFAKQVPMRWRLAGLP
jgi:hypothetical protein